jgi:hypothetical protein
VRGESRAGRCPECGGPAAPRSCDELFQELLALDHSRQAPWGPLHAVAAACFLLQHPSRLPATARPLHWAMLHAYLRGGLAAVAPMTERVRRLNSHRGGGRAPRAGDYPGAPPFPAGGPPRRYAVTIADVALEGRSPDGGFPADGYADRLRAWAADTVGAWQSAG